MADCRPRPAATHPIFMRLFRPAASNFNCTVVTNSPQSCRQCRKVIHDQVGDYMTQAFIVLLFFAALAPLFIAKAAADERWSYYFIADSSRPYFRDCDGDCNFSGTRA